MQNRNPQEIAQFLGLMLQPWHDAVSQPAQAQETVLKKLLGIFTQTNYGNEHNASKVTDVNSYQQSFPVISYEDVKPMVQKVMAGNIKLLLNEDPVGWAITRGTTGDEPKFIPITPPDLGMRVSAGRAMMNFVAV